MSKVDEIIDMVRDICEHWVDDESADRLKAAVSDALDEARREGLSQEQADRLKQDVNTVACLPVGEK